MITNEVGKIDYIVLWRLNEKDYIRECDTLDEAQRIRWKLIDKGKYTEKEVTIHMRQLNKVGDVITV